MEIFEQFKPVKPGHPDFEIVLVDTHLKPVPEADAKAYWANKYDIATYNEGIEAAAKLADKIDQFNLAETIRELKK